MPLDQAERNHLARRISEVITNEFGYTGSAESDRRFGQPHHGHGAPLGAIVGVGGGQFDHLILAADGLMIQLSRVVDMLATLLEGALGQAEAAGRSAPEQAQAEKPKNKGGRPPKQKAEAAPAAEQTDAGFPRPDKGGDKPSNGAGADELFPTEGGDAAGGDDDPLGVPETKPAPSKPQQQLTDVQVKDALRTYMQAYGNEGTARLTDLLTRVAGVKRFSDLPANKWGAVVQAAQAEMAGRK